jgi:diguanylate cyclase (GGDEF)-like protein
VLSLTRTINRLDREQRLCQAALGCYLAVISPIQEYPLETEGDVFRNFNNALRKIQSEIGESQNPEVLEECAESLSTVVTDYFRAAAATRIEKDADLRAVMDALGEASQLVGEQHAAHSEKLRKFTDRLRDSGKETDLRKLRMQIVRHVADLRAIGEISQQENDRTISKLSSQLSEFSKRLDNAEQRACRDGLTGLLNRSEGENRLRHLVESGRRPACALLIDLDGFKKINDSWGHAAGDEVLRNCATVLTLETRPGDLVCRWGGDEFLVILICRESVGKERAGVLQSRLRTPQKIAVPGRTIEAVVSASIGVAELRDDECADEFVARVDAEMYRDKRGNT